MNKYLFNLGYILNFFLPAYLFLLPYIVGEKIISSQVAILVSLNQLFLCSLSGHMRNQIISDKSISTLIETIKKRLMIGALLFGIDILFLTFFFKVTNVLPFYSIVLILIFVWVKEILIVLFQYYKVNDFYYIIVIEIIIGSIVTILCIYDFSYFKYCLFFIIFFLFIEFKIFHYFIQNLKAQSKILKKETFKTSFLINLNYLSSFFIALAAFLIRITLYNSNEKFLAADLIIGFTLGSFLSTLYVSTFGAFSVKEKKKFPSFLIVIYALFAAIIFTYNKLFNTENFFLFLLPPCLIGGIIFAKANQLRLTYFTNPILRENIFKKDIVFSIFQYILLICLISNESVLAHYFLFMSIFSYLLYRDYGKFKLS